LATFKPRTKTEWHVVCAQHHASNRSFKLEPAAHKYAAALEAEGRAGVRVVEKTTTVWLARIRCVGAPDFSKTFDRKSDAEQWAREKEGEIAKRQFVDHLVADGMSLSQLLLRYEAETLKAKDTNDPERCRLRALARQSWTLVRMSGLSASHIAAHRELRLTQVKGTTVKKELELISRVIGLARREWDVHLAANVASGLLVKRPVPQPGDERSRRLADHHCSTPQPLTATTQRRSKPKSPSQDNVRAAAANANTALEAATLAPTAPSAGGWEVPEWVVAWMQMPQTEEQALLRACRYPWWFQPHKAKVSEARQKERAWRAQSRPRIKFRLQPRVRLWALVSLAQETALRRGELLKLQWEHVHLKERYLELPGWLTKNRKERMVPLTLRALRILKTQPNNSDQVFPYSPNAVKLAFIRARNRAGSRDLRFHDLRHEATSRLFEKTSLRDSEIGSVTGHTDPRMLQRYYNKRAGDFVSRFDASFHGRQSKKGDPA
jgi:hypothetical protein